MDLRRWTARLQEGAVEVKEFRTLFTPDGQAALQAALALAPREADYLAHFTPLSRRYGAGTARAALETAILRGEAQGKFPFADQLYLTRPALEQATTHAVAAYRAERYASCTHVADLGCSVGGDTLALCLSTQAQVTGVDLDPLRLAMAQANTAALGLDERAAFVQADLTRGLPFTSKPEMGLFFDPARRSEGRRIFSVTGYHPPLGVIDAWREAFPALGVKVSPGVRLEELGHYPAEIEFISLKGELKEAALWFGPLHSAWRRATVLPGPHSLAAKEPLGFNLPLSEPRRFICEPDPSILRAGLVAMLGAELDASQLDPEIAFLTADAALETPFGRWWQVLDWFPFSLKRLRAYLRQRNVGRVTVKKRGSPLEPETLIRDLRLKGEEERVLFLTQVRGKAAVVVGK